jgi:calcineurin-like phosphoesterase family protein
VAERKEGELMRWATSDHHWGHHNIIKYCDRPFSSVDEMNAVLVARWNESVAEDDEVLLVGDAFCSRRMPREVKVGILRMLNGRKTLIRGNHDDHLDIFLEAGFEVHDHLMIDDILIIHRACIPEHTWERSIARLHTPRLVIHGHTHAQGPERGRHLNVAVDRWDLRPVPWTTVEERLQVAHGETGEWAHDGPSSGPL